MSDIQTDSPVKHLKIEIKPEIRMVSWLNEPVGVVYNPLSGNAFEVNVVVLTLLRALENGPMTGTEAWSASGLNQGGLEIDSQLLRFQKDYLEPLHQLDLIQIKKS